MACTSETVRFRLPQLPARLRPTKAKLRWLGIRALVALVGSYVAYLVVINVLLSTGLGKKLLNGADPAHTHFEWDSAYSLWFAQVHTKGFVVRGTDTCVEWRITSDEASTSFGITDFFQRRVHMHGTTAKGLSVRIRFKVTAPTAEYLAKLPPIEGLPDPPIKPPEKPPLTDANYNLWSVAIDDFAADDFRELWVDTVRFTDAGGGSVAGAFYFKPMRILRIDPSEYTARLGKVETGATAIASDIHGTFGAHIAEFDPRNDPFAFVDASAVAVAKLADLVWLNPIVGPGVALSGGGGPLEVSGRVRQGVIEPGSRFDLWSEGWSATVERHHVSGSSLVDARVPKKSPTFSVVTLESYDVDIKHDQVQIAHAPSANVLATFENTDLAASFRRWTLHLDMVSASVPHLEAMNAYLDAGGFLYGGSSRFTVHGDADPAGASGTFHATLSNAMAQAGSAVVKGNGTVDLTLRRFELATGEAELAAAGLELHDVSSGKQTGYWASVNASPCKLSLKSGLTVQATLAGKARDAQLPIVIMDGPGLLATLVGKQGFTFSTHLRMTPTTTDVSDLHVLGDTYDLRAHYRADGKGKNGSALVTTPALNVGLELKKGSVSVRPFASPDWYAQTGI